MPSSKFRKTHRKQHLLAQINEIWAMPTQKTRIEAEITYSVLIGSHLGSAVDCYHKEYWYRNYQNSRKQRHNEMKWMIDTLSLLMAWQIVHIITIIIININIITIIITIIKAWNSSSAVVPSPSYHYNCRPGPTCRPASAILTLAFDHFAQLQLPLP